MPQIEGLIQHKKTGMIELELKTLPLKVKTTILIGIPFYLIQYRSSQGTRRETCPPVSAASYQGILNRLRRTILVHNLDARIHLLLNPRSTELDDHIFTKFKRSLDRDPALREVVNELAMSRNLLGVLKSKGEVTRGMEQLQAEGWLSREDGEKILSMYVG